MKLIKGIAERVEYPITLDTVPKRLEAGAKTRFTFRVQDPKSGKPVKDFEMVHERLFHVFVISQDLGFFVHEHPVLRSDASFDLELTLPKPGFYRVLTDFYPQVGTPQLVEKTLLVPGQGFKVETARLNADVAPKQSQNLNVELMTVPDHPVSGQKTMMFVRLSPPKGVEPYLGAMGHMLAASWDLIDMVHTHPVQVNDRPDAGCLELKFNLFFPREGVYRVWIQFQRLGVVNTVGFNVPVEALS